MKEYKVIGLMSGTSLDGLDIAFCTFSERGAWTGRIEKGMTVPYPRIWRKRLELAMEADGKTLAQLDAEYGHYLGEQVSDFIGGTGLVPDFIASHGHTVFHRPQSQYTLQIGDGNAIAARTNLPVIYDFRRLDIALGGQGAPLVPAGDRMLFGEYTHCLNLGGIANISFEQKHKRIAYDICPANMALNYLAEKLGHTHDENGVIAAGGRVDHRLLDQLNGLDYYRVKGVKTLGREWFDEQMEPLLAGPVDGAQDRMRTAVEHIAMQVAASVTREDHARMLVTGGGALNEFLVARIRALSEIDLVVPDELLINYKEALVFAFLGTLRMRNEINCLSSVTGASRDCCSGVLVK